MAPFTMANQRVWKPMFFLQEDRWAKKINPTFHPKMGLGGLREIS
jgi:hypothetical protein